MTRDVVSLLKQPARRTPSAKTLKAKATTIHSQYVRARDGRCVRCERVTDNLQCAHIFSRGYSATRTDENNAVCLCSGCHRYLTRNPHEHVQFFQRRLGLDGYSALKDKAYAGKDGRFPASFWANEVARLSALLAGVHQ